MVMPRKPPRFTSPKTVTKTMGMQRMAAGFRLYKAPHMNGAGENDPERVSSQLRSVLGLCHFDLPVDFASSSQSLL